MGSSIDETKINVELTPPPNTNKQYYAGGTNDKTRNYLPCETGDSSSDTDSCARNLDEEHKKEEDGKLHWFSILKKDVLLLIKFLLSK